MSEEREVKGTIRFEDLGEPVQRLLRSLKGDVSDEDMELLDYVSVKDMAKIYGEMDTDRHAEEIWEELREALQARKEKAARREEELRAKEEALLREQEEAEAQQRLQEEEEEKERLAQEEARRHRREERRRLKAEAAAEEDAVRLAEQEAAEEKAAAAEEEERVKRAEKKRKRREARARELQEEKAALEREKAKEAEKRKKGARQKSDWSEYVHSHPLEFAPEAVDAAGAGNGEIEQEKVRHTLNAPPVASPTLLNRTYTPQCPTCGVRFDTVPIGWECPLCFKKTGKGVLVWQPNDASPVCMVCKHSIGRFSRHHCRNCGRLVCANCSDNRAIIMPLGFDSPVKVCDECAGFKKQNPTV